MPCRFPCTQDTRQDSLNFPRTRLDLGKVREHGEHIRIIRPRFLIDGKHPRGVADAEHLLARELPVHIACERRDKVDLLCMFLPVQECLIEVGNAPTLRDVELQLFREDVRRRARHIVPPCTELCKLLPLPVKRKITVHHRADSDRANLRERHMIARLYTCGKLCVTGLHSRPDLGKRVRPDPVLQLVFPRIAAGGNRLKVRVDEDCLDSR